jgi:hypothetical protein
MSGSLAEASAASVQGYPLYTMKQLGEFQAKMPSLTNLERATASIFDVVDFLKSPAGMGAYSEWAKKPLPENPVDAFNLMHELQVRFLGQGRPKPQTVTAETANGTGSTGGAAQPSSGGDITATPGT